MHSQNSCFYNAWQEYSQGSKTEVGTPYLLENMDSREVEIRYQIWTGESKPAGAFGPTTSSKCGTPIPFANGTDEELVLAEMVLLSQ